MSFLSTKNLLIIGVVTVLLIAVVVAVVISNSKSVSVSTTSVPTTSVPTSAPVLVKLVSIEKYQDGDNLSGYLNLGEVKIYDEAGVIIPASRLTPVLSPAFNTIDSFPSSNLLDNDLNNFATTNQSTSGNPTRAPFTPFISSSLDSGQTVKQFMQVKIEPPSRVSKIEVYNRLNCCQARINDVIVKTIDSSNNLLSSVKLKGSNLIHTLTYNSINGSNSNYESTGPNPSDYEMYGPAINGGGTPMTVQYIAFDPQVNGYVFMVIDTGFLKMVNIDNSQARNTPASATDTASSLYRNDKWNNGYSNAGVGNYNVRRKV